MGEIKQTNFRIDSDTADKFRALCEELGYNQAQGFDHLIQTLEINKAKSELSGRLTEIETFETYIKKINESFLNSLQIAQDTEQRVREDFKADIMRRDNLIDEYLQKICEKDTRIKELEELIVDHAKTVDEYKAKLDNAIKQSESEKAIADETKKVNEMLSAKLVEAETKLNGYDDLKQLAENQSKEIIDYRHKYELIESDLNKLKESSQTVINESESRKQTIEQLQKDYNSCQTTIISLKRDLDEQQRLHEQVKELAIQKAIDDIKDKLNAELLKYRDENTILKTKLEILISNKAE